MIIIVTGPPGSGKSLYAVAEMCRGQFKDRPLLVNGIPNLLLPHEPITDEDVQAWHLGGIKTADDKPAFEVKNAVFVIDEVQRLARPRAASLPAPDWIKQLEVHRHFGCDFIIITQHPQQIDAHIRRLVGRHIHVRRTWGLNSAVVYEWDSTNNLSTFKTAQSKVWRYPKDAFKLYKSSELHTKAGGKIPFVIWVLLVCIIAFPIFGWQSVKRVLERLNGTADTAQMAITNGRGVQAENRTPTGSQSKAAMTPRQYVAQFEPRVAGVMHSAPAYDGLTSVKTVPLPAACIESKRISWVKAHGGPCGCYTQTGTPYQTTQKMCVEYVHNGFFLPFLEQPSTAFVSTPVVASLPSQPAPQVASIAAGLK